MLEKLSEPGNVYSGPSLAVRVLERFRDDF